MKNNKTKLKNIFTLNENTKKRMKNFLQKLSSSFGFVIILMPIFGLFYSIGSLFENNLAGDLFKNFGKILFSNIGLWFCLAIIIGFTSNKGAAVYSGIIAYFVFNIFISVFIISTSANRFNIWFWNNLEEKIFLTKFMFGDIKTFNTGVVGGIAIGSIIVMVYNKFKDQNLIKSLSFFAKEKFVILLTPIVSILLAALFIIIWPIIGYAMMWLGKAVSKSPIGLDAFIFRTIQRMLIPFGTSLLWQAPMWYSSIGGNVSDYELPLLAEYIFRTNPNLSDNTIDAIKSSIQQFTNFNDYIDYLKTNWGSEINNLFDIESNWKNAFDEFSKIEGDQFLSYAALTNNYISIQDCWNVGLRFSRFITGGFINSMFTLPTIAFTILLFEKKGERRKELGVYITASLTAFLLGITEPVEYMFCYTMPLFFFAIYAPFNGLFAMLTSLFKVKVGTLFSTGLFDFTLSGILPTLNNQQTNIWILPILGIIASGSIFLLTYFYLKFLKKKNIKNDIINEVNKTSIK
ncbi:PTS transporter subunit EIIC [Spiroplasma turonicum]|uniref:PTS system glucose-specific IIBC component n=1 Tax=Spiroplasma turonicum TaxID=216946 RepID=A0A0K1P5P3_9MOLU|nr:PTS transporter subunit EIIC [Spiroplasma turonicum]AKU79651.1 PTS system glucose-specific IIBC component [Spiroplasma turonicum]ALX70671.1 PTS system, glucose-specific IIBC component [Spiroplasma turonicum]